MSGKQYSLVLQTQIYQQNKVSHGKADSCKSNVRFSPNPFLKSQLLQINIHL